MWRRYWFRNNAGGSTKRGLAVPYAVDVMLANWISPAQVAAAGVAARLNPAPRAGRSSPETDDFLERVYANQEC